MTATESNDAVDAVPVVADPSSTRLDSEKKAGGSVVDLSLTVNGAVHDVTVEVRRTLSDVIDGADLFLGLSGPGVLTPDMVARMADRPVVFALANPEPEIYPEAVRRGQANAIVATGRSDFPNQVNNVLCFPFIFRGALDVGATEINDSMMIACVEGIAALARATSSAEAAAASIDRLRPAGPPTQHRASVV